MEVHSGSNDTFKKIATGWVSPSLAFSHTDGWGRMGFLGVFCDFVLSCTPGKVLEIGVGESSIYLSTVARKFNREIYHCDLAPDKIINPLTVAGYLLPGGVNFKDHNQVAGMIKMGNSCFYVGSSDELFEELEYIPDELALSFIDGDHNFEQVHQDFINVYSRTVDNGYILLHDTRPPSDEFLSEHRCGNVYRLRENLERDLLFDCLTLPRGTAMDVGLTIVRKKPKEYKEYQEIIR